MLVCWLFLDLDFRTTRRAENVVFFYLQQADALQEQLAPHLQLLPHEQTPRRHI